MLVAHVFDLDGLQRAVAQRLGQRPSGGVGVDVDLDDVVVLHQHQGIADAVEECAQQLGGALPLPRDDELRAVREDDVLVVDFVEVRLFLRLGGRRFGREGAVQALQHGGQDPDIALSARVHHAGLFQHGIHLHGLGKGFPRRFQRAGKEVFDIRHTALDKGGGGLCGPAGNGEHRPLRGLHYGFVRGVHAVAHGLGPFGGGAVRLALKALCHAAEQQRHDHAGVAPGAAQQRGGGLVGRLSHSGRGVLAQRLGRGGHGHGHIGPGVAVGHRKYI